MAADKRDTKVRREQIASAALELIAVRGVRGLSVAAIGERVGLVPSAMYRHFESKEEVLDAVLDLVRERLLANVRTVNREPGDALERLHRLLQLHAETIRRHVGIPRLVFSEEVTAANPVRRQKAYGIIREYLREVAGIVRQGQERGTIRPELDPGTVSVMFLGLVQPSALLWQMSGGEFELRRQTEGAWRIFLLAIQEGPAT